jgi:hypothetical protein
MEWFAGHGAIVADGRLYSAAAACET